MYSVLCSSILLYNLRKKLKGETINLSDNDPAAHQFYQSLKEITQNQASLFPQIKSDYAQEAYGSLSFWGH